MISLKKLLNEFSLTKYGSKIGVKDEGKQFSKNSKIKKMVYHYTSKSNKEKILQTGFFPKAGGGYGAGIYFSTSKDIFKGYGSIRLDCFINIRTPFEIKDKEDHDRYKKIFAKVVKIHGSNFDEVWDEIGGRKLSWDTVRIFKKLGYDSIIIGNGAEIIIFDPKNIFIIKRALKV